MLNARVTSGLMRRCAMRMLTVSVLLGHARMQNKVTIGKRLCVWRIWRRTRAGLFVRNSLS